MTADLEKKQTCRSCDVHDEQQLQKAVVPVSASAVNYRNYIHF